MVRLALFLVAPLAFVRSESECPVICCKAFEVSCLSCQFCTTPEEYCQRAPATLGCKNITAFKDELESRFPDSGGGGGVVPVDDASSSPPPSAVALLPPSPNPPTAPSSPTASPPPTASSSLPSSPHPPGHPSPHPPRFQSPKEDAEYFVRFNAVILCDDVSFDRAAYKVRVANATSTSVSQITLIVTSDRINVETQIKTEGYLQATFVKTVLAPLAGNASRASALLGVAVESADPVVVLDALPSPSPVMPPPGTPRTSPSSPGMYGTNTGSDMVVLSIFVVAGVVALLALGVYMYTCKNTSSVKVDAKPGVELNG